VKKKSAPAPADVVLRGAGRSEQRRTPLRKIHWTRWSKLSRSERRLANARCRSCCQDWDYERKADFFAEAIGKRRCTMISCFTSMVDFSF
jgi:hypothetical protein